MTILQFSGNGKSSTQISYTGIYASPAFLTHIIAIIVVILRNNASYPSMI